MWAQRKKAATLAWTVTFRRMHKKDQSQEVNKRKRRNLNSKKPRAIVGASLEVRPLHRDPPSPTFLLHECWISYGHCKVQVHTYMATYMASAYSFAYSGMHCQRCGMHSDLTWHNLYPSTAAVPP